MGKSIHDDARRGALSVERKLFLFFTEPMLSTCVTVYPHFHAITLLGTTCETSRPSKPLIVSSQRQIRRTEPFKAPPAHHGRFQRAPRTLNVYASALSEGDYNCCNEQRPVNPCFPEVQWTNVKEHSDDYGGRRVSPD